MRERLDVSRRWVKAAYGAARTGYASLWADPPMFKEEVNVKQIGHRIVVEEKDAGADVLCIEGIEGGGEFPFRGQRGVWSSGRGWADGFQVRPASVGAVRGVGGCRSRYKQGEGKTRV